METEKFSTKEKVMKACCQYQRYNGGCRCCTLRKSGKCIDPASAAITQRALEAK